MVEAIVVVLRHTGLRVEELAALTWNRFRVPPRSAWADVGGERQERRRVLVKAEERPAVEAIQAQPDEVQSGCRRPAD